MKSIHSTAKLTKSHQAILSAAKALMVKHGIRRITVEELCDVAGISKMTFYRNFTGKNEVAQAIMEELARHGQAEFRKIMRADRPFQEKIRDLIELKRKGVHELGEEFIRDIYQNEDDTLLKYLEKTREEGNVEFVRALQDAQKQGWIRKDLKIELILLMLSTLHDKLKDPAVITLYDSQEELIVEITNFFFYGIFTPTPSS